MEGFFHKKIENMRGWGWQVRVDIFIIVILFSSQEFWMTNKSEAEMHFAIDEDWNCQVIFTLTSISINSTLSQTYNFIPNSSIFYPWMHEKFQQSASISIFSTTVTVIFLPSFFWCYMFETVPLWWAHWICSCSDCQLEVMRYFLCQ